MASSNVSPGRPVRLELNAQRVTESFAFYQELFGWASITLHVPPWGSIPQIANGTRVFGNQFMAMGAFAIPKWLVWFSADLERAEERIAALGGDVGQGIHQLGTLGRLIDARDPAGNPFGLIELQNDPPATDNHGDPCMSEFWGSNASALSGFYADVMGLELINTTNGTILKDQSETRMAFRNTDFDIQPPRWIPYFRTAGTGGDLERARRAGAIVQVHQEKVSDIGDLVVLADPGGAYFGLVSTDTNP